MSNLVNMSDQFKGLPIRDLISKPLSAACESQILLANATASFIQTIGFEPNPDGSVGKPRTAEFKFTRPVEKDDGTISSEVVELDVPLLSIVNVPGLLIKSVDVTFDMEVKSSSSQTESEDKSLNASLNAKYGWGPVKASISISGSISSHKENTRTSDNSAKYHIEVHAEDNGMPEGLARVLDIMATAAAPKSITKN